MFSDAEMSKHPELTMLQSSNNCQKLGPPMQQVTRPLQLVDRILIPILASWCLVSIMFLYRMGSHNFTSLNYVNAIPTLPFLFDVLMTSLPLLALSQSRRTARISTGILLVALSLYVSLLIKANGDPAFFAGIMAVTLAVGYAVINRERVGLENISVSTPVAYGLIFVMSCLFVLSVGGLTVLRIRNFVSPTYDFGIFAQMFFYMKETLQPLTTCERNGLLSHFAIHISPALYLLLPGYLLFPDPSSLNVMQSLVLVSGVIPLLKLSRERELSNRTSLALCILYLGYPALAGGAFYDLHENKLLTPLLLWLFLFIDRKKNAGLWAMALLTLMIKEDAALYVCCVGLYLLVSRRPRKTGACLVLVSLAWFAVALFLLHRFGRGAMTDRYSNFISDPQWGLASVVQTVILNPGYAFKEIFNADKLKFILLMLLPLGGLPLLGRKLEQLVLFIPFVVMNLMSSYPYQHSIYFQYTYGSIAIFFYLAVSNLGGLKPSRRQNVLALAAMATLIIGISHLSGFLDLGFDAIHNKDDLRKIRAELARIPATASVQATQYYLPALAQRRILYDVNENRKFDAPHVTEYVVLDLRPGREEAIEKVSQYYQDTGYVEIASEPELIAILHRNVEGGSDG